MKHNFSSYNEFDICSIFIDFIDCLEDEGILSEDEKETYEALKKRYFEICEQG